MIRRLLGIEPPPPEGFEAARSRAKEWRDALKSCMENVAALAEQPEAGALRQLAEGRGGERALEGRSLSEAVRTVALLDFLWESTLTLAPVLVSLTEEASPHKLVSRVEELSARSFVLPTHRPGLFERGLLDSPLAGDERVGIDAFLELLRTRYAQARDSVALFRDVRGRVLSKLASVRAMEVAASRGRELEELERLSVTDPLAAWDAACALEVILVKGAAAAGEASALLDSARVGLSVLRRRASLLRGAESSGPARAAVADLEDWLSAILSGPWAGGRHGAALVGLKAWHAGAKAVGSRLDKMLEMEARA